MKRLFPEYYELSNSEYSELWKDCIFTFDTNVLLDLYRTTIEASEDFFKLLKKISDRIWLSNRVAEEYLRNRQEEIVNQENAYKLLKITKYKDELKKVLHFKDNLDDIENLFINIEKKINEDLNKFKESNISNKVSSNIDSLFKGKIGNPYDKERYSEILSDGKERYENKIPPGYSDHKKQGNDKYGDLIIWNQIIDHAKSEDKPIIFITNEKKEDWWTIINSEKKGPRRELRKEFYEKTNKQFYVYRSDMFMKYANTYLNLRVKESSIKDVRRFMETGFDHFAVREILKGRDIREAIEQVSNASQAFESIKRSLPDISPIENEIIKLQKVMPGSDLKEAFDKLNKNIVELQKKLGINNKNYDPD